MRKILFFITFFLFIMVINRTMTGCHFSNDDKTGTNGNSSLRILLFTGGHSFDKDAFFGMFFSLDNLSRDTLTQPFANQSLLSDSIDRYDVIVFYDMWQDISSGEKEAFLRLTEKGTGLLFLHHSLASYQEWDIFESIRGGKYYERGYDYAKEKLSGYRHDILMNVRITDPSHPVTLGMQDFEIHDEGYSNIGLFPGITPLLTTDHPDCSDTIAWTNYYNNSRIVYLLLGHDDNAYGNESFQELVLNAIEWTGRK